MYRPIAVFIFDRSSAKPIKVNILGDVCSGSTDFEKVYSFGKGD